MPKSRRIVGGYVWNTQMKQATEAARSLFCRVEAMQQVVERNNIPFRDVLLKQLGKIHRDINTLLLALDELKEIAGTRVDK